MVYTGKPSRGCQTCKSRRIRCDEVRPSCGNCKKSGRTCPGFPDEFDLIFRNENAAVARRTKRAASKQKANPSSSSPSSESSQQSPVDEQSSLPLVTRTKDASSSPNARRTPSDNALIGAFLSHRGCAVLPSLQISLESQATAFFFRNFVLPPQLEESARGFFDLLLPYYNATPDSSPLHLATHAVSLSVLGNYPGREPMMREAARFYGHALRKAQHALQDPDQAKSDETLLTIMLFVLYEVFQNHKRHLLHIAATSYIEEFKNCGIRATPDSTTAWAYHIDGAVTLTRLRGPEQLESRTSRKLFQAVRAMMLLNALQQSKPVEEFPGVPGWAMGEENAANRLTVISLGLPGLRSRVRDLMSGTVRSQDRKAEAWSLIAAAREVDNSLQQWALSLSEHWAHRTIAYTADVPSDLRNAERWVGPVHAYVDVWTSHILNDYRTTRIFTLSIIMACTTVISPDSSDLAVKALLLNAHFVTQGLIDDICASIPFHTNFDLQNRVIEAGQDRKSAEALGSFLLVWHVFIAANVDTIPEPQRAWLQGRLLHIGREFGISQTQMRGLAERHRLMHGDAPSMHAPNFRIPYAETGLAREGTGGVAVGKEFEMAFGVPGPGPHAILAGETEMAAAVGATVRGWGGGGGEGRVVGEV